jgi:hypothetical protein
VSPRRRLAVYRGWLLLNTVLAVCLVLLVPPALFARGFHDPMVVLPGVGLLIGWWSTFVATWCAWQRVPHRDR